MHPMTIAFTGKLRSMPRDRAFEITRRIGSRPRRGVTKTTEALVVGSDGWIGVKSACPSRSLARACERGLPVLTEAEFLEMIECGQEWKPRRGFTADQVARLSGLSVDFVRVLSGLDLLPMRGNTYPRRAVKIAMALAAGLARGVRIEKLIRSHKARELDEIDLSEAQLTAGANGELAIQAGQRYPQSVAGQYLLFAV